MEAKVLGIGEFRKQLSARLEAAHWDEEPTLINHDKRREPRGALVPCHVGDPLPVSADGKVHVYVVSPDWFERANAALAASPEPDNSE